MTAANVVSFDEFMRGKSRRTALKYRSYMDVAEIMSQLSTCTRGHVGCVLIAEDGKLVGTGFNGVAAGMPHCDDDNCGSKPRCTRTRHAERNALSIVHTGDKVWAAFCTHDPCVSCARDLACAGVKYIFYRIPYLSMPEEEAESRNEWLNFHGITLVKMPPSARDLNERSESV